MRRTAWVAFSEGARPGVLKVQEFCLSLLFIGIFIFLGGKHSDKTVGYINYFNILWSVVTIFLSLGHQEPDLTSGGKKGERRDICFPVSDFALVQKKWAVFPACTLWSFAFGETRTHLGSPNLGA